MEKIFSHVENTNTGSRQELFKFIRTNTLLNNQLKVFYPAIVEIVDNVFQHSKAMEFSLVEWSVNIFLESETLTFIVEDNGQGIPNSIRNKIAKPDLSSKDALEFALHGKFSDFRGRGLSSLRAQVQNAMLQQLYIETEDSIFLSNQEKEFFAPSEHLRNGTLVKIGFKIANQNNIELIINDLVTMPGSRLIIEGPDSGEEFRNTHLIPALKQYAIITLHMDHNVGYASSWLSGCFSGLSEEGFSRDELLSRIDFQGEDKYIIEEAINIIKTDN